MSETPEFLAQRLRTEGEKSILFFSELPAAAWERTIYTDGAEWQAHDILAHFVSSEISLCKLVENIVAGGNGTPADFDLDGYNQRKARELHQTPVEELYGLFRQHRERTAQVVAGLNQSDLERQGRHPFLGVAPLAEIIKIIYRHNQIHAREIRKALE